MAYTPKNYGKFPSVASISIHILAGRKRLRNWNYHNIHLSGFRGIHVFQPGIHL